jgi:outer membrane protein OmpU
MNNLRKIGLSALAGSLATFSVNAADVSVSGAGSISFDDTNRGKGDRGNGFYMGDSLKFNMSGETDGGLGVAVYYEIDGGALDDHNIKLSGDWGSLTFDGHGVHLHLVQLMIKLQTLTKKLLISLTLMEHQHLEVH